MRNDLPPSTATTTSAASMTQHRIRDLGPSFPVTKTPELDQGPGTPSGLWQTVIVYWRYSKDSDYKWTLILNNRQNSLFTYSRRTIQASIVFKIKERRVNKNYHNRLQKQLKNNIMKKNMQWKRMKLVVLMWCETVSAISLATSMYFWID